MIIKAIALYQPWAWAMAEGLKRNETRHWSTNYRGLLAIHAAKKKFRPIDYDPLFVGAIQDSGFKLSEAVYGAVVCVVNLFAVCSTNGYAPTKRVEETYGDYSENRFVWHTTDLHKLETPIPLTGHQGLFNWELPAELAAKFEALKDAGQGGLF